MIEKIIFYLLAFPLFAIMFLKIFKKNDTTYVYIMIGQAIGIAIHFIELLVNHSFGVFLKIIVYIFSIIIPSIVIYLEYKEIISFTELFYLTLANISIRIKNNKKAKSFLITLVTRLPDSYLGHKTLARNI